MVAWNQNNVSRVEWHGIRIMCAEWSGMSNRKLLDQGASTNKI